MKQSTSQPAIAIGTPMEGGTFGGAINVNGTPKSIIWPPKKQGEIRAILLPKGKIATSSDSPNDCAANTKALIAAGSPAALRIAELNINGFSDWLIPSRDALELGYRHFKPTTIENWCSWRDGENNSSEPTGWLYTPGYPAQSHVDAFKEGAAESFDTHWYWSSTVFPSGNTAFLQSFDYGYQSYHDLSAECRVRAVRLIQL